MTKIQANILIVDDDPDVRQTAGFILRQNFTSIETEKDPRKLPFRLGQKAYDVILLDMNYQTGISSGEEGLKWLSEIQKLSPDTSVIIITAYGEVDLAVEAMKKGAIDFIVKPWENEKFIATTNAAINLSKSKKKITDLEAVNKHLTEDLAGTNLMVGQSPAFKKVIDHIQKVGPTDANVLITGENGTGKELVAKMIHESSESREKPFIKVDLGSISPTLFESELFGHMKGSFTDAREDRTGRFEVAKGGSLFLDEIANIEINQQSKLLSAIQNQEVFRVGSTKPIKLNIRLICATNMSLTEQVAAGKFREDLYYRINTFEVHLPPLREREGDIFNLSNHFLEDLSKKYRKDLKITEKEKEKLESHLWPGNIRELEHCIERAVILTEGTSLGIENIILGPETPQSEGDQGSLDALEKDAIKKYLSKFGGNMTRVANELKIGRTTLYRKIKKYGL